MIMTHFDKIKNYLAMIKRSPSRGIKYFFLDSGENQFIVNGDKLMLLPLELAKLKSKDEFWLHVDATEKVILYYAYDIEDYETAKEANEERGNYPWDKVESSIYNFLTINIEELTKTLYPHTNVKNPITDTQTRISETVKPSIANNYNYQSPYNHTYVGSPEYKAREAFYDKMESLRKSNHTSAALDYASATITTMCNDKRLPELDRWIDLISLEKLNVITMLGILRYTKDIEIKSRNTFLTKVAAYITKIKPSRAAALLKSVE
jgi:hypothetical protein